MRHPAPALWRCKVLEVHDADTIKVLVDRGMDDQSVRWIRLLSTFAPELSQVGGPESRAFAAEWVAQHGDGTDWPFLLTTYRTPRSDADVTTLSRYVGTITAASGASLNADVQAYVTAQGYPGGAGSH